MVEFEKREVSGRRWTWVSPLSPGMAVGVLLILGGTLLFVDNLNILPFETVGAFWPLALVAYSAAFTRSGSAAIQVWAYTGVLGGILLLLGNYHILHINGGILWPLALIATGIVMLIYRLRWRQFTSRFQIGSSFRGRSSAMSKLEEFAIFSGVKRKIESPDFEGGELTSVFGGIEIDMRFAGIAGPEKEAVIEANTAFGSIELRIPDTWRVNMQGTAIFGAYIDKTIPPRPEPGVVAPMLLVRGGTVFGSVEIRN